VVCRKPLNRRYIIVEAVYANHGDLAPLDEVFRLKEKHCWRLMVEESYSVGVLGATGRGACEHWGLKHEDVDAMCASMGTALGTVGARPPLHVARHAR
jgi:serine palmitoyltransferase